MAPLNLEVVEGPNAGLQLPVDRPLLLGREETADVHLDDPRVSRRHARLTPSGDGASIEDLGSANGTFVNHAQVHASAPVSPGDELLLGTSVLTLRTSQQVQAQPSAVRAVPPSLRVSQRKPDYVQAAAGQLPLRPTGPPQLTRLLDVRVRAQARLAPVAMLALIAVALVIYFGLHR